MIKPITRSFDLIIPKTKESPNSRPKNQDCYLTIDLPRFPCSTVSTNSSITTALSPVPPHNIWPLTLVDLFLGIVFPWFDSLSRTTTWQPQASYLDLLFFLSGSYLSPEYRFLLDGKRKYTQKIIKKSYFFPFIHTNKHNYIPNHKRNRKTMSLSFPSLQTQRNNVHLCSYCSTAFLIPYVYV